MNNDWFTVERIDNDTYVISEYQHYEHSHCYLLMDQYHAILIDSGLGVCNIENVVNSLTNLPIIVLTTHVHWDHIGSHQYFHNIAVHEHEVNWLKNFPLPLQVVKNNLLKEPCNFPDEFNIDNYKIFQGEPTMVLHDHDLITLDTRKIEVIHTPGHSPGHCCFYEPERGYLYSGDLIYKGKLDMFYPTTNPLDFYHSIQKVKQLKVNKILPGHHDLNIEVEIINHIDQAFADLNQKGLLVQGNGLFEYEDFSLHL